MFRPILIAATALVIVSGWGPVRAQALVPCEDAAAFPELAGSLCARTAVPLDHQNGSGEATLELFVRQFPAIGERKGTVWLVAGGPGESGASFYPLLDQLRRAFPGFDLMVPDHRGTGYSSKLCPVEEAPESEDGIGLAGSEWGGCIGTLHQDTARAGAFSITQAAQDLSMLIDRYRGDGSVHVYGVSYGTQLVLRMMQVEPPRLDGLILDSLVPPETSDRWDLSHRTQVTDAVGRTFLGTEAGPAYARLIAAAETSPAWLDRVPGRDVKGLMGRLLDFPELRARIPALAQALVAGDQATLEQTLADLQAVSAGFGRYPQSPSSLPLVMVISGSENNARLDLTPAIVTEEGGAAWFTSPLPGYLAGNPMPLYARDDGFGGAPDRLPPTLVLQGTLDPKTPYAGAVARIESLGPDADIDLVTVEGAPHFILFVASDCFETAVTTFLKGQKPVARCVPVRA